MEFNNIQDICEGLMEKAKADGFLQHPVEEIEEEANEFVEKFSKAHGMSAHTISPYRWCFKSEKHMFEDGVVELQCDIQLKKKVGSCKFEFVDLSDAKISKTQ